MPTSPRTTSKTLRVTTTGAQVQQTITESTATLRERRPARVRTNTWWCPWDDTGITMLPTPGACPMCGATLKVVGEEAVRDKQ